MRARRAAHLDGRRGIQVGTIDALLAALYIRHDLSIPTTNAGPA